MNNQIWSHPIAVLLWVIGMTLAQPAFAADPGRETRATLEVTGRAVKMVKPDTVLMTFTVETNSRQAADAIADNAQQTETLLATFRKRMTSEDHLKTAGFNLQPLYEKDDRLRPSGYRVSNRIELQTRQIDQIGTFIDMAATSAVGRIGRLQFQNSQVAGHRSEAAVQAVIQARTDAQKLAQASGVTIGRVLRVRYAPQGPAGVFYENAQLAMARTPIETGDLAVEAEVLMVFEID